MDLTDIHVIKGLLARHGFAFSKALGQNFLCDPEVPAAIAQGAGLSADSCVLEVGPGIGTLSVELCRRAQRVVAVELDRRLPAVLAETMGDFSNFSLVEGDILKVDIPALCAQHFGAGAPCHAVANLPYYITSPAVAALIDSGCFESITVMVQREVARRICARPATADYGAFTAYINYHAQAQIMLDVPRHCFVPAPNVDSAVVRLDILPQPPVAVDKKALFFVIKAAFSQRRKTLTNCLTAALAGKMTKSEVENLLVGAGLSPNIRGEALSLLEYAQIAEKLSSVL